ncbi:GTP cyclohydrolase [Arthrobacter alpinus]|uniref:GTP cyclohydrolase-2 n=1 Tax=Arthrobacter alpinus TaxID=656366 RepID=A0A0S2M1I8_9MICC|nr:GTP cyclohydrolase II [Arthrobacter alpinus]ALO67344.1 GTP cyclohydrolase [Arthrobacter alpinus]
MSEECLVTGGPVVALPTRFGTFSVQAWIDAGTGAEHLSLSAPGEAASGEPAADELGYTGSADAVVPLVRLHSECLTGDVFGSYRCDCGEQLDHALEEIHRRGGTLVYLRGHEGRGIGLANKIRAYSLQESGADTVEANEQLGLPVDARDYSAAAGILAALGLTRIALLSNNPLKEADLASRGIEVVAMVPALILARTENLRYLETKRDRMHHALTLGDSSASHSAAVTHTISDTTEGPTV